MPAKIKLCIWINQVPIRQTEETDGIEYRCLISVERSLFPMTSNSIKHGRITSFPHIAEVYGWGYGLLLARNLVCLQVFKRSISLFFPVHSDSVY